MLFYFPIWNCWLEQKILLRKQKSAHISINITERIHPSRWTVQCFVLKFSMPFMPVYASESNLLLLSVYKFPIFDWFNDIIQVSMTSHVPHMVLYTFLHESFGLFYVHVSLLGVESSSAKSGWLVFPMKYHPDWMRNSTFSLNKNRLFNILVRWQL